MKGKYWIIRTTENMLECLKFLGIHEDYIPIMLNNSLDYLIAKEKKYICLCYKYEDRDFYWLEFKYRFTLKKNDYKYGGEINLRREKLKKLNETFRRNISVYK
jgi:hypothetical protein